MSGRSSSISVMDASPANSASVFVAKPSSSETELLSGSRGRLACEALLPLCLWKKFPLRGLDRWGAGQCVPHSVLRRRVPRAFELCTTEIGPCLGKTLGPPSGVLGAEPGWRATTLL